MNAMQISIYTAFCAELLIAIISAMRTDDSDPNHLTLWWATVTVSFRSWVYRFIAKIDTIPNASLSSSINIYPISKLIFTRFCFVYNLEWYIIQRSNKLIRSASSTHSAAVHYHSRTSTVIIVSVIDWWRVLYSSIGVGSSRATRSARM